jgi:hypothetical protein
VNVLTGLGLRSKDKRVNASICYEPLTERDAEELYGADDIAARVVDIVPQEGTRRWINVNGLEKEQETSLNDILKGLYARDRLSLAWTWSRLYGGAGVFVNMQDGLDPSMPVDPNRIKSIKSLTVLSRYELYSGSNINSDILSNNFGYPEMYQLQARSAGADSRKIHYTRILRFDGADLPRNLFIENNYWGDSVLTRLLNALRNFNGSHDSAASILHDFRQGVLKLKHLADMIASNDDSLVTKRIELMNLCRSVLNTIVLDDEESYEQQISPVTGVKELLEAVNKRLATATGLPHTIVFGESPSGLGASGDSEKSDFYDQVSAQQELKLRKPLEYLITLILLSKDGPTNGIVPEGWGFEFNSLWQMDDKEKAEIRKVTAESDAIYIDRGVLDPTEARNSRFGGESYSIETQIEEAPTEEKLPQAGTEPQIIDPTTGLPVPSETKNVQQLSLNGAQVQAMIALVQSVAQGMMPRESAVRILEAAFGIESSEAERIVASAGKGFKPAASTTPQSVSLNAAEDYVQALVKSKKCSACGTENGVIAHHVVTRENGGSDDEDNLMPICRSCHSQLHNSSLADMAREFPGVSEWLKKYKKTEQK